MADHPPLPLRGFHVPPHIPNSIFTSMSVGINVFTAVFGQLGGGGSVYKTTGDVTFSNPVGNLWSRILCHPICFRGILYRVTFVLSAWLVYVA